MRARSRSINLDALIGTHVAGRYAVVRKLGVGGMGAVYLATQEPLGRQVAIKVLLHSLSQDATATQRFQQEAQAVSRLNHPNIVTIHDFGRTEDGLLYIAMEYMEGRTLREIIDAEGAQPWPKALGIVMSTARALAEAHGRGIIHRDLKPDNIMLVKTAGDESLVKVLDFGLAKMLEGNRAATGQRLTEANVIMGTPGYMSPEQIQGMPLAATADIYALGVLLWESLVGKPPIDDANPMKVLMRHLVEVVPPPSKAAPQAGIPRAVDELVGVLLAKDPAARPQNGAALLPLLKQIESESWSVAPMSAARQSMLPAAADEESASSRIDRAQAISPSPVFPQAVSPSAPQGGPQQPAPVTAMMDRPETAGLGPPASPMSQGAGRPAYVPGTAPPTSQAAGRPAYVPGTVPPTSQGAGRPAFVPGAAPPSSQAAGRPAYAPGSVPVSQGAGRPGFGASASISNPGNADFFAGAPISSAGNASFAPPRTNPGAGFAPPPTGAPQGGAPWAAMPLTGGAPQASSSSSSNGPAGPPLSISQLQGGLQPGAAQQPGGVQPALQRSGPAPVSPAVANAPGGGFAAPPGSGLEVVGARARSISSPSIPAKKTSSEVVDRKQSAKRGGGLLRAGLVLLLVVVVGAGAVAYLRPELVEPLLARGKAMIDARSGPPQDGTEQPVVDAQGTDAYARALVAWRGELGPPLGTVAEHAAAAAKLAADETWQGAARADVKLREALLVEPKNRGAIAAFAENVALLQRTAARQPLEPAEVAVANARRSAPDDADLLRAQGALLLARGLHVDAAKTLVKSREQSPADPRTLRLLAEALLDEKPDEARGLANLAHEKAPGSSLTARALGAAERRVGAFANAKRLLDARIAVEPQDTTALVERARVDLDLDDATASAALLDRALRSDPEDKLARMLSTMVLYQRLDDAKKADTLVSHKSFAEGDPVLPVDAHTLQVERIVVGERAALAFAETALARAQNSAPFLYAIGGLYAALARDDDAVKAWTRAATLATATPGEVRINLALGDQHINYGRFPQAAEAYARAVAAAPASARAHLGLVAALLKDGKPKQAKLELALARGVHPGAAAARAGITHFPAPKESWAAVKAALASVKPTAETKDVLEEAQALAVLHGGDVAEGLRRLNALSKRDKTNPSGPLFAALVEMDKSPRVPPKLKLPLVATDDARYRLLVVAQAKIELMNGNAEAALKALADLDVDDAKRPEAATVAGEALAAAGKAQEARQRLLQAFNGDRMYLPAKQALARATAAN